MPSSVPAEPATGRPTPRWALIGLLVAFLAGGWLRL
jgi:hypothetical protein